ncbi:MAG TPA: hypothetical protein PL017_02925 [Tenuifilaceae bacterium]|nr:hypothetical protein [Tenuifilaceae bacterium]HPE17774.1 hypothetical protein [Tenuifilaceae bacterium]HPJ45023.1 hypothetical protein [Tenuifilaceae bacterium]HPQ34153.1 hypothetical protein [Tenuifilaceae bacterium]HRX67147.1 hypothetical protein [Tenuifilaceae bacterium]
MGFFQNQSGIMRRFLREEGAWENHLQKTRSIILEQIQRSNPKSVTILGSGWLLDIPLAEILDADINVRLVDIAHPSRITHKFRNNSKISFINFDISGAIDAAWDFSKSRGVGRFANFIHAIQKPISSSAFESDLFLSINLLSQLHFHIVDFLQNKGLIADRQALEVTQAIQQSHIDFLPKGGSLLVTDFEEELYDNEGRLVATKPRILVNTTNFDKIDSWLWNFDSHNEFDTDYNVRLNVSAYRI